jgi:hypothetical protein
MNPWAATLVLLLLASGSARAAECAHVKMPDKFALEGKELVLNGMGLREATVLNIDVYVAGLYLERRATDGEQIARSEQWKQMRLTFLRDVDREDMAANLEAGFRSSAGSDYEKFAPRFERLKKVVPQLKQGDTFFVTYRPGTGLEVRHGQRLLVKVPGADFARAIFLIWLGKKPPNEGLKTGLLGGRCG